jgi:tRNA (cmo5U34)-methyltransferase
MVDLEFLSAVRDVHSAQGFMCRDRPTIDISDREKKLVSALIAEEAGEFVEAAAADDLVEIADALADLLWVVGVGALTYGIPLADVFDEVLRSNRTKVDADGKVQTRPDGKLLKGPGFSPPDLGPVLAKWSDDAKVTWYLERQERLAPRAQGDAVLLEELPASPTRLLDLGCGDGRLAAAAMEARPSVTEVVAVDFSEPMLQRAGQRFADDRRVEVRRWDLNEDIRPLGRFDVIVSGLAIHHLEDDRKRALFSEAREALEPDGRFCNLDVVASASSDWHATFLAAIEREADDPEDRLAAVDDQLAWLAGAGFSSADCLWRWRGLALMVGRA